MVLIGYRHEELDYVSQGWLVFIEVLSKIAFGFIMLPLVYLLGFFQRENAENVYKSLGVILYIVGHFFNMILLSIIGVITKQGKFCEAMNQTLILYIGMLNPFTFSFFNSTLDYFICEASHPLIQTLQWVYCIC